MDYFHSLRANLLPDPLRFIPPAAGAAGVSLSMMHHLPPFCVYYGMCQKEGSALPDQGTLIARVYTSDALIPLANVPVTFETIQEDGTRRLLAIRLTNSSGLTEPLTVETPDASESLSPGLAERPYTAVDITAETPGYKKIDAQAVQVFPGVTTIQNLRMIPRESLAEDQGSTIYIQGSTQNL